MSDRPNILFIITDQQRFDTIGALGNACIRTPNLDRLVGEGTAFTEAITPSPECVPARCAFTFGQYPAQTQCRRNGEHFPLGERETVMDTLSRSGYRTHGIGKYHFSHPDAERIFGLNGFETREIQEEIVSRPEKDDYLQYLHEMGYRHVLDPHGIRGEMYYMPQPAQMPAELHPTHWVGDRTTAFLEESAGEERPWFCYASFIHPHPPFCPPAPWHKLYRDLDTPPVFEPDGCEENLIWINRFQNRYKRFDQGRDGHGIRMMRAYYYACISFIDFQVGRILEKLDETGQAENTLIVFTSDHGELLGDYRSVGKRSYHDVVMKVPMILRQPGVIPAGIQRSTPVSLLDLPKTFLESAGASFDTHKCEGDSLVGLAQADDRERTVYTQLDSGARGIYTAMNRNWKLVYSAADQRELLFDRVRDPGETRDLAGVSRVGLGYPESRTDEVEALRKQLREHLQRVGAGDAYDGDSWRSHEPSGLPDNANAGFLYQDHPWARGDQRIPGYAE